MGSDREEHRRRYGVVVSNQSPSSALFYDIEVHVEGRGAPAHVLRLKVLPPGQIFFEHKRSGAHSRWEGIPLPVRPSDVLDPFTVAGDRAVTRLDYTDGLGTRWQWTSTDGLRESTTASLPPGIASTSTRS